MDGHGGVRVAGVGGARTERDQGASVITLGSPVDFCETWVMWDSTSSSESCIPCVKPARTWKDMIAFVVSLDQIFGFAAFWIPYVEVVRTERNQIALVVILRIRFCI